MNQTDTPAAALSGRLFDTPDAATYLGLKSPRTLIKWRGLGTGPRYIKLGRVVRYRLADLDAFVAERTRRCTLDDAA